MGCGVRAHLRSRLVPVDEVISGAQLVPAGVFIFIFIFGSSVTHTVTGARVLSNGLVRAAAKGAKPSHEAKLGRTT